MCADVVLLTWFWSDSIEVTLSSAPPEEDAAGDVGLQLQVNFVDKAVQRNARLAGKWGQAENTLSFFPFAPGESFKVEQMLQWERAVVSTRRYNAPPLGPSRGRASVW